MVRQLVSVVKASIWEVALAHIAKQAFNGVGTADITMHHLGKSIQGREMLFIFAQATDRLWIALLILRFEGRQVQKSFFFAFLMSDPFEFSHHLLLLSSGNSAHDVALLMHQTSLTQGGWKEICYRCKQALMPIGDDQVNLAHSTGT